MTDEPGPGSDGAPGVDGEEATDPDEKRVADPNEGPRHDRITVHRTPAGQNSLASWTDARHPLRVALTYLVVWLIRMAPSLAARRWLLRRIGVTVGEGVSWGLEATPDVFWPDHITVEDRAIIGYDATLLCHEFLQEEYRVGRVVIGEESMIGAGAIVLPGVHVGAGASVAANSLVTEDVPPGETVAGVPATPMSSAEITDETGTETGATGSGDGTAESGSGTDGDTGTDADETDAGTDGTDQGRA